MDGRRALVIDDEVHFRYFLRVLLEKAGFAVKMARNGIEALDVLRSWRPDVITLDVMMPEQSGLTFYGAVCRDEDWKRIPVVMLSAVPISASNCTFWVCERVMPARMAPKFLKRLMVSRQAVRTAP